MLLFLGAHTLTSPHIWGKRKQKKRFSIWISWNEKRLLCVSLGNAFANNQFLCLILFSVISERIWFPQPFLVWCSNTVKSIANISQAMHFFLVAPIVFSRCWVYGGGSHYYYTYLLKPTHNWQRNARIFETVREKDETNEWTKMIAVYLSFRYSSTVYLFRSDFHKLLLVHLLGDSNTKCWLKCFLRVREHIKSIEYFSEMQKHHYRWKFASI